MAESFESYSNSLLEKAKRFLEKAKATSNTVESETYLSASLVFSFFFLEAQVNSICDDMLATPALHVSDRAVLEEKELLLSNGEYRLGKQRFFPTTERMEFLIKRFSTETIEKQQKWWPDLKEGQRLRNDITHPRSKEIPTIAQTEKSIRAVVGAVDFLYRALYKRSYPYSKLDLHSKFDF